MRQIARRRTAKGVLLAVVAARAVDAAFARLPGRRQVPRVAHIVHQRAAVLLTAALQLAAADTFEFASALSASNVDTITDFEVGTDVISLENAIFTALSATPNLTAAEFVAGAAAGDATDRIIYDDTTGALFYDEDGTGAAVQQQFAVLSTGLALSETDFVIV